METCWNTDWFINSAIVDKNEVKQLSWRNFFVNCIIYTCMLLWLDELPAFPYKTPRQFTLNHADEIRWITQDCRIWDLIYHLLSFPVLYQVTWI